MTSTDKVDSILFEQEMENRSIKYKIGNLLFLWGPIIVLISFVTSGVPSEHIIYFSVLWNIGFGVLGTLMCFLGMWLLGILNSIAWLE